MAVLAHGAEIWMSDMDPTPTFTKIPGPGDIEFTPPQPEDVDVTNHDSDAREFLQGLGTDGELTTEFHFDGSEPMHIELRNKMGEADPTDYQIRFPDASALVGHFAAGFKYTMRLPVGDAQVMSGTFKISGALTW